MTEVTVRKKLTIQDILNEGKKSKQIPVGKDGYLDYIDPTENEVKALEKESTGVIRLERERRRLVTPNPTPDEKKAEDKELEMSRMTILEKLKLWKGLNKVDPAVTREMVGEMPSSLLLGITLKMVGAQLGDLSEEELGKLKNSLELQKGLAW